MLLRISLTVTLCIAHTFASSFHKKVHGVEQAHNKLFHDSLKKQLDASRIPSTHDLGLSNFAASIDGDNSTYATGSTASFQLYTSAMLSTPPVPSSACTTALTATIQCNSTVPLMSSYPYLLINDLGTVCTTACTNSLASYRANVVSACGTYRIPGTGNSTYLPTFAIDTIAGPYTVQCLQDPASMAFCEPLLNSYNTSANSDGVLGLPTNELCTFCTLGTLNRTLSNPTTYSVAVAGLLSSAVQKCGSAFNSYNVSSPPFSSSPPILNPTNPGSNITNTPSSECAILGRNITVPSSSNTTCLALGTQYSVAPDSILASNPFLTGSSDCSVVAGSTICIPQACTLYTVQVNDTCNSVGTAHSLTPIQVQSFNPSLGTSCQLISSFVGKPICVSPNGGFPTGIGATSNGNPSATPTTVAPVPTPTVSGTTNACGKWYQVQAGDICNSVALNNSVSLPDFLTLNPEVNANCTNLWLDYYYCVAPYPPFNATSATAPLITGTQGSVFAYPIPTASYTPTFFSQVITPAGVPAPTNVAAGTRQVACGSYYTVQSGDTVASIAALTNTTSSGLISWNPELSTGSPSGLVVGKAICILFPKGNYTLSPAPVPGNLATSANVNTSSCAQYYTIVSGDSCGSIEQAFALTSAQFLALNPGVNAQCTNIILGEAYCVFSIYGGSAAPPPTGPPANVAPGTITTNCTGYYTVVSGDSCGAIESKFNITDSLFHAMNPEISSTCNNIVIGEAYCTGTSNTTNPTGPPSNVAPGTITNGCTTYYTVVSGDSCGAIESKFNISDSLFHTMNPEITSTCTNIILGDAYCVATSNSTTPPPTGPPSNVAPGTITSGCTAYYTVVSGDSCGAIESRFSISDTLFHTMNPEITSTCTNIIIGDAYCVATSNSTTPPPTGPPSNLATGSLKNCTTYYTVVSGDSCTAIDNKFTIALSDFFRWNPEVNTACTNIAVGSAYCVAGGGNGCQKEYTVVSGDSCGAIESKQSVTAANLKKLNPWLDANCDIQVGQRLCVG